MKLLKFFTLALCLACFTQLSAQNTLPDVNVKTLDGKTVNIQDFGKNGKITIISFWATWCSPCKKELDAVADLYPEWQEKYDVEFLAITIDNARALPKVGPMVDVKQWEYTILSDSKEELKRALNFQTVPYTLVIDQKGNIVDKHSGYVAGDEYELEDKIKKLAAKK
ncbi:MAG: TlpA family protein disulfide reductase [Saprospiraceae bacterium]